MVPVSACWADVYKTRKKVTGNIYLGLSVGLVLAEEQHMLGLLFHAPDIGPVGLPLPLLELGYGNVWFHPLCFLLQCLTEGRLG